MITASESFGVFYIMFLRTHSMFTTSKEFRSPSILFLALIYKTATFFVIDITSSDLMVTSLLLIINLIL
jgi:hypothetical protein